MLVMNKDRWWKRGGVAGALLDVAENEGSGPHDQAGDPLPKRLYQVLSRLSGATVTWGRASTGIRPMRWCAAPMAERYGPCCSIEGQMKAPTPYVSLRLTRQQQYLLSGSGEKEEAIRWSAWRRCTTRKGADQPAAPPAVQGFTRCMPASSVSGAGRPPGRHR